MLMRRSGGKRSTELLSQSGPQVILIDIGRKIEGSLSIAKWHETQEGEPKAGDSGGGYRWSANEEGYYELSTLRG